jgi:hypothetical protein
MQHQRGEKQNDKTIPGFKAFPGQCAVALLASALVVPAVAQQTSEPQSTPPAATSQQPSSPANAMPSDKEGFWGHVNPFARKKWVKKRLDPINDRLTELDQVNAKNATDIKDVDARAQAGIQHAQSTADAANQAATAAGTQAQGASTIAQGASGHVDQSTPPSMVSISITRSAMSKSSSSWQRNPVQGRESAA